MIPSLEAMLECTYDPTVMVGKPIGMFHCPECGEMVVAGMPHPDYDAEIPVCKACGRGPLSGPEELLGLCRDCM